MHHLIAYCLNDAGRHTALIDVSGYPNVIEVPEFGKRAKSGKCGGKRVRAPELERETRDADRLARPANWGGLMARWRVDYIGKVPSNRDHPAMTEPSRRFPAPRRPDRIPGGYVVRDSTG